MISKRLLLYGIILFIPWDVQLYEYFGVRFSHSTCEILNHEIVFNLSCTSRVINRTRYASFDSNLQPDVELYNVYVMATFYYKFGTAYRPHMIKMEQELCQFLKDNTTSKLFPVVASKWRETGNFLDPCPIKGRRYITDYDLEYENFPIEVLPAGEWRLDTVTSTKVNNTKIKLFAVSEYFEIKTKTALQWKK